MMFYVYIIKSNLEEWYYVGMTQNLDKRLEEHNTGKTKSTKKRKPYILFHYEEFETRQEARNREKQIKNGHQKRRLIDNLIEKRDRSSTG